MNWVVICVVSIPLYVFVFAMRVLDLTEEDREASQFEPMPQEAGGADFSLVELDKYGKPSCKEHGAMNKVSEHGYWRCITLSGPKTNPCRAACQETR